MCCGGTGLERFRCDLLQTFNAPNARAAAAPNPLDTPVIRTHLFFNGDFMV
jgi:hypothetical protein